MANDPTSVCNEALDAIGAGITLGDVEDGSDDAQIILRAYWQALRRLLRAANWSFARKQTPLVLLADRTGNTPDVGTMVPNPWIYEYSYPTDAAKVRFVLANPADQSSSVPAANIQTSGAPIMTGLGQVSSMPQLRPAKFVVGSDPNYPPTAGEITWEVQGVSPQGRTVILTNVRYAEVVYTQIVLYPSVWDVLFRNALVATIASDVALPVWAKKGDAKMGMAMRRDQIAITKGKVTEARAADGNEGTPGSDLRVDWIDFRNNGGGYLGSQSGGWGDWAAGGYGGAWDSMALADGSVF